MPVVCAAVVGAKVRRAETEAESESFALKVDGLESRRAIEAQIPPPPPTSTPPPTTTKNRTTRSTSRLSLRRPGSSPTRETRTTTKREAPCASTLPSTLLWTRSTRGSLGLPPRRAPLSLLLPRQRRRRQLRPARGPGASLPTRGRPTWACCILRTSLSSTGERGTRFGFWSFGLDGGGRGVPERNVVSPLALLPPLTRKPIEKQKELSRSYASNTRVKLILIASDPQPREEELRAVRGVLFFGGWKKGCAFSLPSLSQKTLLVSPVPKTPTKKQVFKRIHAAFVEASCNPFYTADSVRKRKRERRNKAQKERRERRLSPVETSSSLSHTHSPNFNTLQFQTNRPSTPPSLTPPFARSSAGREVAKRRE